MVRRTERAQLETVIQHQIREGLVHFPIPEIPGKEVSRGCGKSFDKFSVVKVMERITAEFIKTFAKFRNVFLNGHMVPPQWKMCIRDREKF